MKRIKLSQWAKDNSYTYQGAYNLHIAGKLDTTILASGAILVNQKVINEPIITTNQCIIYARVSSHKQKDDLSRQVERLQNYAINSGLSIKHVYKEIASGMNDNRPQLNKLIEAEANIVLIIEHKDRLTRFGYNYLLTYFRTKNVKIDVVNYTDNTQADLIEDLVSIITSFCARLYGQRKGSRKTTQIKTALEIQ